MRLINKEDIALPLTKCYSAFDPMWGKRPGHEIRAVMESFKHYIEREAGVKLNCDISINEHMQYYYKLDRVEIVDENQYLLFLLRWA